MARTRRPLIAGNWKMNGLAADALALAKGVAQGVRQAGWTDREVLVCPPATLVMAVAEAVKGSGVLVGGEDCHAKASGAHTGDVSAEMLKDAGASHVIVGHSERRTDHGETDAVVRAKAQAAWRAGLLPIVCIGETLTEREAGKALSVLESQLKGSVPAGATAAVRVCTKAPITVSNRFASSFPISRRTADSEGQRRSTPRTTARSVGRSATHSATATNDRAPAATAHTVAVRTTVRPWRIPRR